MTEISVDELVTAVKKYAQDHYNDGGWDYVVECWSDSDLRDVLSASGAKTVEQAIRRFSDFVSIMADREADAKNSTF